MDLTPDQVFEELRIMGEQPEPLAPEAERINEALDLATGHNRTAIVIRIAQIEETLGE